MTDRPPPLAARRISLGAATFLRRQRRTRARLGKAVAAWAALSHADRTPDGPLPVTTVAARNAAGQPITVRIYVTIEPTQEGQP